jgi:hypothetical protein
MDVIVGGPRDVRATLDGDSREACVVACPPHPRQRGSRSDERLRALSRALVERGVDCLRIDYGPWADGNGEVRDARNAVRHVRDTGYERVALFGYSFGASVALLAAAGPEGDENGEGVGAGRIERNIEAVSTLAPASRIGDGLDVVVAAEALPRSVPLQVIYGARDDTVDWRPVVDAVRARESEAETDVVELPADHFFVGQAGTVAERVAPLLVKALD